MMRLFLLLAIILLAIVFIRQLKKHLTRDKKLDELREVKLNGDLLDIDKEIATEKSKQQTVSSEIEDIKQNKFKQEEENYD